MFDFIYTWFDVETVKTILYYTEIFFIVYLVGYSTFLFVSVVVGSNELFENIKRKRLRNEIHHDFYVPISIVVPAYNEEVTICKTIESLLNLNYRLYEIIIVSDGSTDQTAQRVIEQFELHEVQRPIRKQLACQDKVAVYEGFHSQVKMTLVIKENGGKADAINMGINVSQFPYFVCMDADSILERDSLEKIAVKVLESENVIAVGSMISISNDCKFKNGQLIEQRLPRKLIPALQVLEYERSFLASRILLDKFNANLIVSGAFGLFKKDAVIAVGGYQAGSIGEDMELIVKLHDYHISNGLTYYIKYAYEAVCWTQAPERLRDLLKQRKRWHIGLFQSLISHRTLITKASYIYYLVYELLSPFIELVGLFVTFLAVMFGLLNFEYMLIFFLTYALFGALLTVISYTTRNFLADVKISMKDVLKAFLLCVPENVGMRFILAWTRIFSILFYRGKKTKWGKIKRVDIDYDK